MLQTNFSNDQHKAYQHLTELCRFTYQDITWQEAFWNRLCSHPSIYDEWVYYTMYHTLQGAYKICGYSLIDVFVWQMNRYNLFRDLGKHDARCNKAYMVLRAFDFFLDMENTPEKHIRMLESDEGRDVL